MSEELKKLNKEIHEAFKITDKRISYLYKKYGKYQFTLHNTLQDAMEKAYSHKYHLGDDIVDIIEIADYKNMTWYRYDDIKDYWKKNEIED